MIHASKYLPKLSPIFVDSPDVDLDRVQDLSSTLTVNRTKIEEVGRVGIVGFRKSTPNLTLSMKQLEYGNIQAYVNMANLGATTTQVNATDFKTSAFDILGFTTDDTGTFLGTIWYPKLRLSGFSLAISDPQQVIERTFNFMGEDEIPFENNSAYIIRQRSVLATSGNNKTILINNPGPSADPDNSGKFLLRVVRCPANGTTPTELNWSTDWSYDGVNTMTVNGPNAAGDVIWYWYAASTYLPATTIFTPNNSDLPSITAESASIYLINNQYVYRLQSVQCDCTLTRKDVREIGNQYVVSEGVQDINTKVTIGRILEAYTIEEVMRGVAGTNPGKLDPRNYTDNFQLVIKVYSAPTKTATQFKLGYKFTDLAPTSRTTGATANTYVTAGVTMEGQSCFITNNNAIL